MRLRSLTLLAAIASTLLVSTPARAGTEQEAMRTIANISRRIIDPVVCNPANIDWEKPPHELQPWTLWGPVCTTCGGTPNHKLLLRVWNYGWALHSNQSDAVKATHRTELLNFINQQQTGLWGGPFGHYTAGPNSNEELTSSHYQLYAAAMATTYLFAVTGARIGPLAANPHLSTPAAEVAMRDAVRRWWTDEKVLYDQIHTNFKIDAPGARFGSKPTGSNQMRDDVFRLLRGLDPNSGRDCKAHKSDSSIFVLQALKEKGVPRLGDPLGGPTPKAKLMDTLCVYRFGSDWTLYFPEMRNVGGPLYWIQYRAGVRKVAELGHNPPKPDPYPGGPEGASRLPIDGVYAGFAKCPLPEALNQ